VGCRGSFTSWCESRRFFDHHAQREGGLGNEMDRVLDQLLCANRVHSAYAVSIVSRSRERPSTEIICPKWYSTSQAVPDHIATRSAAIDPFQTAQVLSDRSADMLVPLSAPPSR